MSVIISFGDWPDHHMEYPDGSGDIIRRGFRISWAKPLQEHVLFSLKFQIRISDVEVEQSFTIRAF